ncbi:MAG: glycosyltransferase family 9 protein [Candidatus Margulisiibacteriota bacterium]
MKIILVRPDAIGDMILLTPTFSLLKQGMPHCYVAVLGRHYTQPLLIGNYDVDEFRTENSIKRGEFDAILHAYNEFPYVWKGFINGIKYRVADRTKILFSFLNNVDSKQKFGDIRYHEVEHNLFLAKALFDKIGVPYPEDFDPELKLIVPEKPLPFEVKEELIGIHPGTGKGNRAWLPEKYAELVNLINDKFPQAQVVLTGSRGEMLNNQKIIDLCKIKPINAAGQTDLETLIVLISKMKCLISVDTGPMHIAAALKRPIVAISPVKYVKPTRWGPYKTEQVIVRNTRACPLRCNPYKCKLSTCMDAITPEMVLKGLEKIYSGQAVPADKFKEYHIKTSANILIYDDTRDKKGKKYYDILAHDGYQVEYWDRIPMPAYLARGDINFIHIFSNRAKMIFKLFRPFVSPFISNPPVIFLQQDARDAKMESGPEIMEAYLNNGS